MVVTLKYPVLHLKLLIVEILLEKARFGVFEEFEAGVLGSAFAFTVLLLTRCIHLDHLFILPVCPFNIIKLHSVLLGICTFKVLSGLLGLRLFALHVFILS